MTKHSSKFDATFRDQLNNLPLDNSTMSWDAMFERMSAMGLSDLELNDIQIQQKLNAADAEATVSNPDWNAFEQILDSEEQVPNSIFDQGVRSKLNQVSPLYTSNSWDDFYFIYRNYISLRRQWFLSRFIEFSYLIILFMFMGSMDFNFGDKNIEQGALVIHQNATEEFVEQNNSGITALPPQALSIEESNDKPTVNNVVYTVADESVLVDEFIQDQPTVPSEKVSSASIEDEIPVQSLVNSFSLLSITQRPVFNQSFELPEQTALITVKPPAQVLFGLYYGHTAIFRSSIKEGLLQAIDYDQFMLSNFIGFDLAVKKNKLEYFAGVQYRENTNMQEIYQDEVRSVEAVQVLQVPVGIKFAFGNESKKGRPYAKLGSTASMVVQAESEAEYPLNVTEDRSALPAPNAPKEADVVPPAPVLDDFKNGYFSLDMGIGYEYQFTDFGRLFMDIDYRYQVNNFKTTLLNPNYFLRDNLSVRLGGRFIID